MIQGPGDLGMNIPLPGGRSLGENQFLKKDRKPSKKNLARNLLKNLSENETNLVAKFNGVKILGKVEHSNKYRAIPEENYMKNIEIPAGFNRQGFHFITTKGDRYFIPLTSVDQVGEEKKGFTSELHYFETPSTKQDPETIIKYAEIIKDE